MEGGEPFQTEAELRTTSQGMKDLQLVPEDRGEMVQKTTRRSKPGNFEPRSRKEPSARDTRMADPRHGTVKGLKPVIRKQHLNSHWGWEAKEVHPTLRTWKTAAILQELRE